MLEIDRDGASPVGDRHRLLVDAITDYAIYMLDPNGIVSSWNPGARLFKGYEEAEIIGQHFSRFYTEEDRKAGKPAAALRAADLEGRFEAEGWRLRKDGSRFWAYVIIDPIRSPHGELIGFAKVTRDLTQRKEAEEALRRSEEQFRLLVQGVLDYAIYMLDLQGNVSSWNSGAERIKGYAAEEIIGRHFSVFYTDEDKARGMPRQALETAARTGRFERESWRVRKDGSRFMAHVIVDAVRNDAGDLIGFAKVTRDITERMENQHRLEQAREALFQAQKMEAVGQLSAGIAHDFNNLLAAILGGLELLRKRMPDDPRTVALLDTIAHAASRGSSLTQRMLSFARRQELRIRPVDVAALVEGMTELMTRTIGPLITVEARFPPDLPPVFTDPVQLETALLNLAINARDAMPDGGRLVLSGEPVVLSADNAEGLRPGEYVRIGVRDDGCGMDEATLARAVEPFFTTKGIGKGTGLGLSMVHGLAAQSGGTLRIASTAGEGTTVDLFLRAADPAAPVAAEPLREAPPAAPARALRLLVVDDDELVLSSTLAMLEDLGHAATGSTSATEALTRLDRGERYDAIVTDHAMPGMTGLELAERIKAGRQPVPVLIVSGFADFPHRSAPVRRLAKPFTQDQLSAAIAETIGLG